MENRVLRQLIMLSKYFVLGFCVQLFFTAFLLASTSKAQKESLEDINVSLKVENQQVKEVFQKLEQQSNLKFSYNEKIQNLTHDAISIDMRNGKMSDVLREISSQTNLKFLRINNSIHVVNKDRGDSSVDEIISERPVYHVTGMVTDTENFPIPGATVKIKDGTRGTVTDIDGKYQIDAVEGDVLVFSFVGFVSQEIQITNQTVVDIVLEEDLKALEEVVVVGYGEQKKETLTGSVVSTKGEIIAKSPVPNVTNALQGRLPGVIATNTTGEPGRDDAQILIRGRSTFGNSQPLLVIDGVPRPGQGLGRIDPKEIESITVLKDASAAIYGARAANGVILVKTKRGGKAKPEFNFSYNQGFSQPTRILDVLDAPTYAQVRNEAEFRNGSTTPIYTEEDIQKYSDGSSPLTHPNTDWVGETLKNWSLQNKVNLSVNGGSEDIQYYMSLGVQNQDGHFVNNPTQYSQVNLRANLDANITDNFKVSLNLAGRKEDRTYPSTGTWVNFVNILSAPPVLTAQYPNGLIAAGRFEENPLLRDQAGYLKQESYPIQTTLLLDYELPFIEGLTLTGSYSYDFRNDFEKTFQKPYSYWEYDPATGQYNEEMSSYYASPTVRDYFDRYFVTTYNLRANYTRTVAENHHFNLLVGVERAETKGNNASAFRRNFPTTVLTDIDFGGTDLSDQSTSGSSSLTRRDNLFGRLNYDYKEKYLVEFLFRYDGSPIFPAGDRYGFFPGLALGWRLSEENFLKNSAAVDFMKLRVSYGELGNDNVDDPYAYLNAYSIGNAYTFGGSDVLGLTPEVLPNYDYTWEVLRTANIGLEATFWNAKLGVELDVFKQNRSNILAQRQVSISSTFGFPGLPPENIGKVSNHGFELVLSHQNHVSGLLYRIKGNMSFARNKYEYFDEVPAGEEYQNLTGRPIGSLLIWPTNGVYNTQAEIDNSPHLDNAKPGDLRYVDYNGDDVINGDDQYRFGKSTTPEIVFGLDLNFQYKNFDLSTFFQGQGNAAYFPGITSLGGQSNGAVIRAEDRWTTENTDGAMPAAGGNFAQFSEFNLYSAAFVRLKNLELGYSFPEHLLEKLKLNRLRVYTNAFNVFTFSEIDFMDPEGRGDGNDPNSTRTDANYYPQLRVFNIGVDFSF
ncbi:TonB-dependent receptor [Echinicola soli]|uniref:TonB-dependent receptor n=1 Tax=Echinicola soli TaxID=2591634 RepID=A0A514CFZ5_9BACT|nr:TonB-dependent receptor [Echinicola soli]QDH78747.1 TonB-dependent receptor [Echinicola soli]